MSRVLAFMFWCAAGLSLLVFLLGCFVVLAAPVGLWMMLGVGVIKTHVALGLGYLVGTVAASPWLVRNFKPIWQMWFEAWAWADDRIAERRATALLR